jgi:hypothetical protein
MMFCVYAIITAIAAFPAVSAPADQPVRIAIVPRTFVLDGKGARQRILVNVHFRDGRVKDATPAALIRADSRRVAIDQDGLIRPLEDGVSTVTARVGVLTAGAKVVVKNQSRPTIWSFENDVEPILSKQGCNMGPCHGAAAGKGGFRLTLRAYDPDLDHRRITKEVKGRRIVITSPQDSLLLKKPSLGAPHVGGLRLRRDSDEYRVIEEWIAAGAPGPNPREAKVSGIDVYPAERTLSKSDRQQILVTARYSDGRTEDVTHLAKFSSNDDSGAKVDDAGSVEMRSAGETAVSVWYQGKVAFSRLSVPFPYRVDSASYARAPKRGYIDELIHAKLVKLRVLPSEQATDSQFIRRVYLDVIGALPTPEETRAFLADSDPQKRDRLIDSLLQLPEYVDHWTYRLSDLFRVNRDLLGDKGMWEFHAWLRQSIAENKPWDGMAREIITSGGSSSRFGPAAFLRSGKTAEEYSETVSQVFLGIRVQCAKCHNHPFEKWTQSDYFRMANFFARVSRKDGAAPGGIVYFDTSKGNVDHPKLGKPLDPTPFDGPRLALDSPAERRTFLADWLTSRQNPYFARNMVNRIWKHYMGRGLVEPADDMRLTNPATNEPLLDALSTDFAENGFDLKRLTRGILRSAAYQSSSGANATNGSDARFYSRYIVKRLNAETVLDAFCQVTEQAEKFPGIPAGARAVSLPDTNIASSFLDLFGRPVRQVSCDCERNMEPSVSQALHLISAEDFNKKVSAKAGVVDRLMKSGRDDRAILNELYLACFSREPSQTESANMLAGIRLAAPNRRQALVDILWALLSSPEFLFNH